MMDLSILWDVADWTRSAHLLTHLHISNFAKTQVFLFPLPHLCYISSWNKSALNSLPSHNIGSMPFSLKGLTPIYIFIYHLCIISALLPCSYQKHYIGLAQIFPYFTLELQLALVSGFILASLCLYSYLELQWGNLGQKDSEYEALHQYWICFLLALFCLWTSLIFLKFVVLAPLFFQCESI